MLLMIDYKTNSSKQQPVETLIHTLLKEPWGNRSVQIYSGVSWVNKVLIIHTILKITEACWRCPFWLHALNFLASWIDIFTSSSLMALAESTIVRSPLPYLGKSLGEEISDNSLKLIWLARPAFFRAYLGRFAFIIIAFFWPFYFPS